MLGLLASADVSFDGIVLLTPAGRTLQDILRFQLVERQPVEPSLRDCIVAALDAAADGRSFEAPPPPYDTLFRPSVRPFLRSVMRIDPVKLVSTRREPILVVGGGADIQTPRVDFDRLVAAPQARLTPLWLEAMSHALKPAFTTDTSPFDAYAATRPLMPGLVEGIAAWLQGF